MIGEPFTGLVKVRGRRGEWVRGEKPHLNDQIPIISDLETVLKCQADNKNFLTEHTHNTSTTDLNTKR